MNEVQLKSFNKSKEIVQQKGKKEIADKIVWELEEDRRNPTNVQGQEFEGDVFYSMIDGRLSSYLPQAKSVGQKQTEIAIFDYVCGQLRKDGFYVHS